MSFQLDNATKPVIDSYFRKYDTDHNGYISQEELRTLIKEAGYNLSDEAFRIFLTATDSTNDGKLSIREFVDAWMKYGLHRRLRFLETEEGEQMVAYFTYFDPDYSGEISRNEFGLFYADLKKNNLHLNKSLHECLTAIDSNKDGQISFFEFMSYMDY